jgi:hypothetical protein
MGLSILQFSQRYKSKITCANNIITLYMYTLYRFSKSRYTYISPKIILVQMSFSMSPELLKIGEANKDIFKPYLIRILNQNELDIGKCNETFAG